MLRHPPGGANIAGPISASAEYDKAMDAIVAVEQRFMDQLALAEQRAIDREALAEQRAMEREALAKKRAMDQLALAEKRAIEREDARHAELMGAIKRYRARFAAPPPAFPAISPPLLSCSAQARVASRLYGV